MNDTLLIDYMKKSLSVMKILFPNENEETLKTKIKEVVKENIKYERNIIVEGEDFPSSVSVKDIDTFIAQRSPILDGHGTLFKRHEEEKNILGDMCDEFMVKRKVYKKKKFEHINDEDKTLCNNYDMLQKNMKILNNSFYGASAEQNSIFYNPMFGPSVTYQGEDIIMTAVNAFECFLSNNFTFKNISDVLNYCNNIINEEYNCDFITINRPVNKDEILQYLLDKTENNNNFEVLQIYLDNVDPEYYNRFYFKNNLVEFFERTNIVDDYFGKLIDRYDFADPNEPPEDMIPTMDRIWDALNDYVFYNYQNFYRYYNCHNVKRKTVLTIDTDSNFLYLYPYFKYFKEKYPDRVFKENDESVVCVINLLTYQLTKLINLTYLDFTKACNVPEAFRPRINMKNEFLLKKIMLTQNKKNYASIVMMQEGNILKNYDLDIKGLPIRKVSVNKKIRDYFTDVLENDILKADNINLSKIIYKYKNLENIIKDSLLSGSTDFATPAKVNDISSYVNPYQIMSVRATLTWNELFPDQEITFSNKINILKLNITDYDDLCQRLENIGMYDKYISKFNKIFANQNLVKNGLNVIALPKTLQKIPEVIREFIDFDTIITDSIKPGIILLESLGFKTLDILDSKLPTNILEV